MCSAPVSSQCVSLFFLLVPDQVVSVFLFISLYAIPPCARVFCFPDILSCLPSQLVWHEAIVTGDTLVPALRYAASEISKKALLVSLPGSNTLVFWLSFCV